MTAPADTARWICTACEAVFDPAAGDPSRGVPPGTPFRLLAEHWRCPGCGGPQHGFRRDGWTSGGDALAERLPELLATYHAAEPDMRAVNLCNPALTVEAASFREHAPGWLGVIVAPWFFNAVWLPRDPAEWEGLGEGDRVVRALPSGEYNFIVARVGPVGKFLTLPLVSTMTVFPNQEEARAAALAAVEELLRPEEPATTPSPSPAPAAPRPLSRRTLFRGRGG